MFYELKIMFTQNVITTILSLDTLTILNYYNLFQHEYDGFSS